MGAELRVRRRGIGAVLTASLAVAAATALAVVIFSAFYGSPNLGFGFAAFFVWVGFAVLGAMAASGVAYAINRFAPGTDAGRVAVSATAGSIVFAVLWCLSLIAGWRAYPVLVIVGVVIGFGTMFVVLSRRPPGTQLSVDAASSGMSDRSRAVVSALVAGAVVSLLTLLANVLFISAAYWPFFVLPEALLGAVLGAVALGVHAVVRRTLKRGASTQAVASGVGGFVASALWLLWLLVNYGPIGWLLTFGFVVALILLTTSLYVFRVRQGNESDAGLA